MRFKNITTCFLFLLLILLLDLKVKAGQEFDFDKINKIADFMQINQSFADDGRYFCGPVAASNYLMWLGKKGYNSLIEGQTQAEIIKKLAIDMNTNNEGTSTYDFCHGLQKYFKDHNVSFKKIYYQGWRNAGEFSSGNQHPSKDVIISALKNDNPVWINVGWYNKKIIDNKVFYERYNGHWMAVVGYGYDGTKRNQDYIILHDSAKRAGTTFQNDFVKMELLSKGELKSAEGKNYKNLPCSAKNYFKLTDGLHLHKNADTGIMDGLIVLEL
jgi:hypothetical protein